MTTALLGRLVDQGKLHWDDPVTKYLPAFRMHDPWVTANMRVADLLTHSSGLPEGGGDLMLWPEPNAFTRADIIHGLAFIKPGYSFRSQYQYDNLLYVVAGEVAAAAGGASYETLMHREVFEPLGLSRCQVGAWNRDAVGNVAQPHRRDHGTQRGDRRRRRGHSGDHFRAGRRHPLRSRRHAELGAQLAGADTRAAGVAVADADGRSCSRRTC